MVLADLYASLVLVGYKHHTVDDVCRSYMHPLGEPIDFTTVPGQPPVHILPDDLIMADINGVLRLRLAWVNDLLAICARQSAIDERCMADLKAGHPIKETLARHRGK
jgi:hypothetical protein